MARNKHDIFEPCHLRAQHEYRTGLVNEVWAVYAVYFDLTKPVTWSPTAEWGVEDKDHWLNWQALPCSLGKGIPDPTEEWLVSWGVPQGQRWAQHWLTVALNTDLCAYLHLEGIHPVRSHLYVRHCGQGEPPGSRSNSQTAPENPNGIREPAHLCSGKGEAATGTSWYLANSGFINQENKFQCEEIQENSRPAGTWH